MLVFIFALIGTGSAFAQAMHFSYDLNSPSYSEPRYAGQSEFTKDTGLTLGFGFYSRPVCADCSATRIGLVIGYQEIFTTPVGQDLFKVKHKAVNIQAAVDRRVFRSSRLNLAVGVALGLSFISNNIPCNELFCGVAKTSLLVSPNLKAILPVSSNVSATIEVRGAVLTDDRATTFPFKTGGIVAIGIEVHSGPKVESN